MPRSITPSNVAQMLDTAAIVDVRKEQARLKSGRTIPGALRLLPQDAGTRWREFEGQTVVLFCVHGHEVSQTACALFEEKGVDAHYLAGGFEAWQAAGLPTDTLGKDP
nr:rhodanese-like domain-containing protein [Mesorhizobium sp. Z1-4]